MPHITSIFLSSSLRLMIPERIEQTPAPICAQGPSLPAEPPPPSVTRVAMSFTGTTLGSTFPDFLWTASITFSVPCPSASGASFLTIRELCQKGDGQR